MDVWFHLLVLFGTVAFSISGALTGIRKHMDIFGVVVLGLTTAVGGGVIRDLVLGITPPVTFQDPLYAIIAIATSIIVFLPPVRRRVLVSNRIYDAVLLMMDSLGLGAFTVTGIQTAYSVLPTCRLFLLVFVGIITGVGGGILRDVLSGDTPYIFSKHIYASASLAGAILCVGLWSVLPHAWATLIGMAVIVLLRLLSAHFRWNLPHA